MTVETLGRSGAAEGKNRIVLTLEPAGNTWKVVNNR